MTEDKQRLRDAATIVLLRDGREGPEILMGQRGAAAAFMPNKFVFPGGAVDAGDRNVPLAAGLTDICARRLGAFPQETALGEISPETMAVAAIRELWEETGLTLAREMAWPQPPVGEWAGLADRGLMPDASGLSFIFRAITPPGRPRRFDARFFLADVNAVFGDHDDFSQAQDELALLQWIPIQKARSFDLPFITEIVLAEVARNIEQGGVTEGVPFFDNSSATPTFRRIE